MTEREKMLSGEYYDPSDAELVKLRLEACLLTEKLNQTSVSCPDKRVEIIKSLLGSTGSSIHIESTFNCDYGLNIHVGENFLCQFWLCHFGRSGS
ncbi:hypothetical protein P780_15970, partial [Vibrio mimicus CAIM 1882]